MWPWEGDTHGGQESNFQIHAVPPSWEIDSNVVQLKEQSWSQSRMLQGDSSKLSPRETLP